MREGENYCNRKNSEIKKKMKEGFIKKREPLSLMAKRKWYLLTKIPITLPYPVRLFTIIFKPFEVHVSTPRR